MVIVTDTIIIISVSSTVTSSSLFLFHVSGVIEGRIPTFISVSSAQLPPLLRTAAKSLVYTTTIMSSSTPASAHSKSPRQHEQSTESTPLLASSDTAVNADGDITTRTRNSSSASSLLLRSIQGHSTKKSRAGRWPTFIALIALCLSATLIMIFAFIVPQTVQKYAMEAMVIEPTNLSIDSFTSTGLIAKVSGTFTMDASKVQKKAVRDIGRLGTWIASSVESKPSKLEVMLPEYDNIIIGTAEIPAIKVDIRNGHTTPLEFLTEVVPGSRDGLQRVARDWLDKKIGDLRLQGKASVSLKSGLLSLGTRPILHEVVLKGKIYD